jgi:hypothetical protein
MQTVKPDAVYLNVPYKFKRTGESYDLTQLKWTHPSLIINRCDDHGPITKLLPTIESEIKYRDEYNTVIIYTDDDAIVPSDLVEKLVKTARKKRNNVIHSVCGDWFYSKSPPPVETANGCALPEAYEGILLPLDVIPSFEDFKQYVKTATQNKNCFRGDDFVLASYYASRGISREPMTEKTKGFFRLDDAAGLKDIDGTHPGRYEECRKFMDQDLLKNKIS